MTSSKVSSSFLATTPVLLIALVSGCFEAGPPSIRVHEPVEVVAAEDGGAVDGGAIDGARGDASEGGIFDGAMGRSKDGPAPGTVKNGSTCAEASDCASKQCVDGVCCDQACQGTCFSCNQLRREGTCLALDGAEDHAASATCEGASVCTAATNAAPQCLLKDGEDCTAGSQCYTGICMTMYFDGDHDGFGGKGTIRRCGRTPPEGYTTRGGDCCDREPKAYPDSGESSLFPNLCGSFDWDCNGTERPVDPYGQGMPTGPCGCGETLASCTSCD